MEASTGTTSCASQGVDSKEEIHTLIDRITHVEFVQITRVDLLTIIIGG